MRTARGPDVYTIFSSLAIAVFIASCVSYVGVWLAILATTRRMNVSPSVGVFTLVTASFLGDLRWVARFEPNRCEPNRSTYRQCLPKVCLQQFHGQDEN